MSRHTRKGYRHERDSCVGPGKDALYLAREAGARSVPAWSLSSCCERSGASTSESLEDGLSDAERQ